MNPARNAYDPKTQEIIDAVADCENVAGLSDSQLCNGTNSRSKNLQGLSNAFD